MQASSNQAARPPVLLHIGGQDCEGEDGRTFRRCGPLEGVESVESAAASTADAHRAAEAAAAAQPLWTSLPPQRRRGLLLKAADELEARTKEFESAMLAETGASAFWAQFNVHLAGEMLREAAGICTRATGLTLPSEVAGSLAVAQRVPAGVVLGIAPWNAPVILGVRALAAPLACGNAVIFKGSEICPTTHRLIVDALVAAGLPAGVVNYISQAPEDAAEIVGALIAHPAVRRVNFTGSTRVGREIALACARELKPSVLELGGKAPFVVLDDADLDDAVKGAVFGAFANSGQICMSTERIIVCESVADDFVMRLGMRAKELRLSDPRVGPAVLGSVVSQSTVDRCNALIDDALIKGAVLVCGGRAKSPLMQATILDHVTPEMQIYHEESFGPVKPVIRVPDVEGAIHCANDSVYGLSAAVYGRDLGRAWQVASRIRSGICHVNGPTVHDEAQMPFGGVGASGWGRFGGDAGIHEFTDLRWMTLQTEPRHYPF